MYHQAKKTKQTQSPPFFRIPDEMRKQAILIVCIVSMVVLISLLFTPFYSHTVEISYPSVGVIDSQTTEVKPLQLLSDGKGGLGNLAYLGGVFGVIILSFVMFMRVLRRYSISPNLYANSAQQLLACNSILTGLYYVAGVAFATIKNGAKNKVGLYASDSYLPFLLCMLLSIVLAFVARSFYTEEDLSKKDRAFALRIEFFVYGLLAAGITIFSSLSDILKVTFVEPLTFDPIMLNGYKLFNTYNSLGHGFQMVAFVLFAIMTITISLAVASLVSLISKSEFFYKITLWELIGCSVFSLLIGLFGKYYEIVQKLNEEGVLAWLNKIVYIGDITVKYRLQSDSFYFFLAVMAVILIVLIRKPYTKGQFLQNNQKFGSSRRGGSIGRAPAQSADTITPTVLSDPCPAFTELDRKAELFEQELAHSRESEMEEPTLSMLVQYIVQYARDSRLHLSYTEEDIAAFLAGLGATRLTILQGMSGTGKTSLPKIVAEALCGQCDIIEIESSWRDKNELLGYYNEFSRIYTPKKFTQALYKAALDPHRITLIVLDEMNLSRIEYYFSDFLSLMENEENKRAIKLLNVSLYRTENEEIYPYLALTDGHTLKIPPNVWFVGTANRDESTFEISDKVYDRAHTMNFNRRAPKVFSYAAAQEPRFISSFSLLNLLENAKGSTHLDITSDPIVKDVEMLLEPYNISFGNRIANQMEDFVAIYCACFPASESARSDAIEKILLSKVVSKLEFKSIDNKEYLAQEFKKRKLYRMSDFILKLNED